jgi:hypothetical protein
MFKSLLTKLGIKFKPSTTEIIANYIRARTNTDKPLHVTKTGYCVTNSSVMCDCVGKKNRKNVDVNGTLIVQYTGPQLCTVYMGADVVVEIDGKMVTFNWGTCSECNEIYSSYSGYY